MRRISTIDLCERPAQLLRTLNAIQDWAKSYQRLVCKLLGKAAASRCRCCNGTRPSHMDDSARMKEQRRLEDEISTLMEDVGI
jgi:hypothetical protein